MAHKGLWSAVEFEYIELVFNTDTLSAVYP